MDSPFLQNNVEPFSPVHRKYVVQVDENEWKQIAFIMALLDDV